MPRNKETNEEIFMQIDALNENDDVFTLKERGERAALTRGFKKSVKVMIAM
jgi:hypothetical protein